MKFHIVNANIANCKADAIVLPANTHLKEGAGVSNAIFEAAGRRKLVKACEKLGTCPVGSAVPTLAYDLSARFIIHTVVPKWIDGMHNEYELLSAAYLSALHLAEALECESIAFPLLASGNNGYDLKLAFEMAKSSIEAFEGCQLKEIILVIYGERIASIVWEAGYSIEKTPMDVSKLLAREAHRDKMKEFVAQGKNIAQQVLEEQIEKALEYLKDEKNREKILAMGKKIVKWVLATQKIK